MLGSSPTASILQESDAGGMGATRMVQPMARNLPLGVGFWGVLLWEVVQGGCGMKKSNSSTGAAFQAFLLRKARRMAFYGFLCWVVGG